MKNFVLAFALIVIVACHHVPDNTIRTCHEDFVLNGLVPSAMVNENTYRKHCKDLENCPDISLLSGHELYEVRSKIFPTLHAPSCYGNFNSYKEFDNFQIHYLVLSLKTGFGPALNSIMARLSSNNNTITHLQSARSSVLACLSRIDNSGSYTELRPWYNIHYVDSNEVNACLPENFDKLVASPMTEE